MKNILAITLVLTALAVFGQETQTRDVESFSGVNASKAVTVYLKKGTKESVKVEVSGVKMSSVMTEVSGSYLKVWIKGDVNLRDAYAKVYVTYVNIEKLSASSAANIYAQEPIKSRRLDISSASAGTVEVEVDSERVDLDAASAGDIEIRGKARTLSADASTAGEIDAYDLECETVDVSASSSGHAKVFVSKELKANASTAGVIRYRGNPERSFTDSSTAGSVKKN